VWGNRDVPPREGPLTRGQGVTGSEAPAIGERLSPPMESAPSRDVAAHPTLAEVMKEAALAVDKRAIHA
jgi:hypothetical protein